MMGLNVRVRCMKHRLDIFQNRIDLEQRTKHTAQRNKANEFENNERGKRPLNFIALMPLVRRLPMFTFDLE